MRIVFQHIRNTKNIGDRSCSPFDYFNWPENCTVRDIRTAGNAYDISVIGGGKIFGGLAKSPGVSTSANEKHIAWGVSTVQSFPLSLRYFKARKICNLVGTRDWGDTRYEWAPCVSCMAPQFENPPAPKHDFVFYSHAGKTAKQGISIPKHVPTMTNHDGSLDDALSFIASGETVVSNSYHGIYWALLMGRKVLCIPFSNKFEYYRMPPAYSNNRDWLKHIGKAVSHDEMLGLCQVATQKFYKKVLNWLE